MVLKDIIKELEELAEASGAEVFIDDSTEEFHFIPVINQEGVVGAIGQYIENNKVVLGFFILNDSVVRYALSEGFKKDDIYKCFKSKLFKEVDKIEFFNIMTKKKY